MNKIFFRDFTNAIKLHPESWNKPCLLPRDSDCGSFINPSDITRIDSSLKVIEWKSKKVNHWTHFDEIYIANPTKILGKTYIHNVKETTDG